MNKLFALTSALMLTIPGAANARPIVFSSEQMVVVPGLEYLGFSRISTVKHCAALTQTKDWQNMITDTDFVLMEDCLLEHT